MLFMLLGAEKNLSHIHQGTVLTIVFWHWGRGERWCRFIRDIRLPSPYFCNIIFEFLKVNVFL